MASNRNRAVLPALLALFTLHCGSSSATSDTPDAGAPNDTGSTSPETTASDDAPSDDAPPAARCPDGTSMSIVAGKILIDVTIDGGAPMKWILDTGAPSSMIDTTLGLDHAQHVLHALDHDFTVRGMPTGDVKSSLQIPGVVGIFGMELLAKEKASLTLDYPRNRVWIDDARDEASLLACAHVAGAPLLVPYKTNGHFFVQGKLEDVDGWFLVDSGATLGAVPDDVFDALNAAHPRTAIDGFYTPAFVGTFWARMSAIGSMTVGDGAAALKVDHIVVRTIDPALLDTPDSGSKLLGLLPSGWLHHTMMTLDFAAHVARFDAARDDTMKEPSKYFSVGIGLEHVTAPPIHVTQIVAGGSAQENGVAVGDELVSIEGTDVSTMEPYARPWKLMASTDGATIHVGLKHAGANVTYALTTKDLLTDP